MHISHSLFRLEQLKVTHPDGKPATGATIRVTIGRGYYDDKFYNKTFLVTNGVITESINDATYNSRRLFFKVGYRQQKWIHFHRATLWNQKLVCF